MFAGEKNQEVNGMKKLHSIVVFAVVLLLVMAPAAQSYLKSTPDGGYILATSTTSFGVEQRDIWVVKIGKENEIEWQKAYGKSNWEGPFGRNSLDVTKDGGYIIVGVSHSSKPQSSPQPSRALVLRLDPDGNPIWQRELKKEDYILRLSAVRQTKDGGFIAVGNLGPMYPKETKNVDKDAWVVKLDEKGSIVWQKTYGGDLIDWAHNVIQTDDGNYLFVGETCEPKGRPGTGGVWVVKLGKRGSVQWQKSYSEPMERPIGHFGVEIGYSVRQMSNGDYLVVGTTRSFGTGGGARGDIWVLRLDPMGGIKWQKAYGGVCLDTAPILKQSTEGDYVMGANTKSFGPWDNPPSSKEGCYSQDALGISNTWIFQINENGQISWQNVYGTKSRNFIGSLVPTMEGGYLVHGVKSSSGSSVIFRIDGEGNLLPESNDKLNVASTSISPQITTTEPMRTRVKPEPIEVKIYNAKLEVAETDASEIFLTKAN